MSAQIQYFQIKLKPLDSRVLNASGSVLACTAASGPFYANLDGHGEYPMRNGLKISTGFKRTVFRNPSNADLSISLYVAMADVSFIDNQLRQSPTYTKGYGAGGLISLAAAGTQVAGVYTDRVLCSGSDSGNARAQIIVTNMAANQNLYVTDADGNLMAPILPGRPWTLATSGYLTVLNPNAGIVQCIIGETFYSNL